MIKQYLSPGKWEGEGILKLSMFEEALPMHVHLHVCYESPETDEIHCEVEYNVLGYEEVMKHSYYFSHEYKDKFVVTYENKAWGRVQGKGFITKKFIGIEYLDNHARFEGFETYKFEDKNNLYFTGEFTTPDGLRSESAVNVAKQVEKSLL